MIEIHIDSGMLAIAKDFAEKKVSTTYMRLSHQREEAIERLFAGKIGEMVGIMALKKSGIPCNYPSLFTVIRDEHYGDVADCFVYPDTPKQKSVDFKTAWKPFQTRLLVAKDMLIKKPKNVYIGVKIDLDQHEGIVYGYILLRELRNQPVIDWGEGPAYSISLTELHPLHELSSI